MIRYENIDLHFGQKIIFADFSLKIAQCDKVVLLAKSGFGKSSLFAMTLGFLQPQGGRVFFNGTPVDEKTAWDVRKKVSFIDQDVSLRGGNVTDWLSFIAGFRANQSLSLTGPPLDTWMDFFELSPDLLNKHITELSGGERQRFAIIISLLLGRTVFLLDEVTSALDKPLKKKVVDLFTTQKEWTVVSISHDALWLDNPCVKVFDLETRQWKQ